jgi:hypothetical protein
MASGLAPRQKATKSGIPGTGSMRRCGTHSAECRRGNAPPRRRTPFALLLALLLACALPAGASAATRWAAPDVQVDSTNDCSEAHPCNVITAVNNAANGDEVILKTGTYVLVRSGVTLQPPFGKTVVHGDYGNPRPIIVSDSDQVMFLDQGSAARWLTIQSSADNAQGLVLGGSGPSGSRADQIYSQASGKGAVPCAVLGWLTNSLCYATGANANAVASVLTGGLGAKPLLSNVTAIAPQPDATAVYLSAASGQPSASKRRAKIKKSSRLRGTASGTTSVTLNAFNLIASGGTPTKGGFDIFAQSSGGSTASATLDFSNYVDTQLSGSGATVTAAGTANNQRAAPKFTNAKKGDFHEAPCSPTKDQGDTNPAYGPQDLDGQPRTNGDSTDIGAYESFEGCPAPGRR